MKKLHVVYSGLVLISMAACHKDKDKNGEGGASPTPVVPVVKPLVTAGLHGGLVAGGMNWTLPQYLEGQFKNLGRDITEASIDVDLIGSDSTKGSHINSGFQAKSCEPVNEGEAFTAGIASDSAENAPEKMKADMFEISSWTAASKTFQGRLYLKKRYKAEGDTGIYRFDALVVNTKTSECVSWNLVFTPVAGVSSEFVEGSQEYKALIDSLTATWKAAGADFVD